MVRSLEGDRFKVLDSSGFLSRRSDLRGQRLKAMVDTQAPYYSFDERNQELRGGEVRLSGGAKFN